MSLKIRLTESQYKSLLTRLDEVTNLQNAFDKIKKGYKLMVFRKDFSTNLIVIENHGGYLEVGVDKDGPINLQNTVFRLTKESFSTPLNLLIESVAKYDKQTGTWVYTDKTLNKGFKINKISKSTKDWFINTNKKIVIKNVTKIDILDTTNNIIDTILTDSEVEIEAKKEEKRKEEEDRLKKEKSMAKHKQDMKDIIDMLKNDPLLKKAFYHQPKLWNLIKIGDPIGIHTTKELVGQYKNKKLGKSGVKFKTNTKISFEVLNDDIEIIGYDSTKITLLQYDKYIAVVENVMGEKILKSSKFEERGYNFKIKNLTEVNKDTFEGEIVVRIPNDRTGGFSEEKKDITIKILNYNI